MKMFNLFCRDEKGGGLVEYVLIVTLIVLGAIAGMTAVGGKLNTNMTNIGNTL
jgi:Flp pilus assembly pilin Flp